MNAQHADPTRGVKQGALSALLFGGTERRHRHARRGRDRSRTQRLDDLRASDDGSGGGPNDLELTAAVLAAAESTWRGEALGQQHQQQPSQSNPSQHLSPALNPFAAVPLPRMASCAGMGPPPPFEAPPMLVVDDEMASPAPMLRGLGWGSMRLGHGSGERSGGGGGGGGPGALLSRNSFRNSQSASGSACTSPVLNSSAVARAFRHFQRGGPAGGRQHDDSLAGSMTCFMLDQQQHFGDASRAASQYNLLGGGAMRSGLGAASPPGALSRKASQYLSLCARGHATGRFGGAGGAASGSGSGSGPCARSVGPSAVDVAALRDAMEALAEWIGTCGGPLAGGSAADGDAADELASLLADLALTLEAVLGPLLPRHRREGGDTTSGRGPLMALLHALASTITDRCAAVADTTTTNINLGLNGSQSQTQQHEQEDIAAVLFCCAGGGGGDIGSAQGPVAAAVFQLRAACRIFAHPEGSEQLRRYILQEMADYLNAAATGSLDADQHDQQRAIVGEWLALCGLLGLFTAADSTTTAMGDNAAGTPHGATCLVLLLCGLALGDLGTVPGVQPTTLCGAAAATVAAACGDIRDAAVAATCALVGCAPAATAYGLLVSAADPAVPDSDGLDLAAILLSAVASDGRGEPAVVVASALCEAAAEAGGVVLPHPHLAWAAWEVLQRGCEAAAALQDPHLPLQGLADLRAALEAIAPSSGGDPSPSFVAHAAVAESLHQLRSAMDHSLATGGPMRALIEGWCLSDPLPPFPVLDAAMGVYAQSDDLALWSPLCLAEAVHRSVQSWPAPQPVVLMLQCRDALCALYRRAPILILAHWPLFASTVLPYARSGVDPFSRRDVLAVLAALCTFDFARVGGGVPPGCPPGLASVEATLQHLSEDKDFSAVVAGIMSDGSDGSLSRTASANSSLQTATTPRHMPGPGPRWCDSPAQNPCRPPSSSSNQFSDAAAGYTASQQQQRPSSHRSGGGQSPFAHNTNTNYGNSTRPAYSDEELESLQIIYAVICGTFGGGMLGAGGSGDGHNGNGFHVDTIW